LYKYNNNETADILSLLLSYLLKHLSSVVITRKLTTVNQNNFSTARKGSIMLVDTLVPETADGVVNNPSLTAFQVGRLGFNGIFSTNRL